jgi:serpin B
VSQVYVQGGFSILPDFKSTVQKYFGVEPAQVDFSQSEATAKIINEFVSTSTHGKIQNSILSSVLTPKTSIFLISSVYFKGAWDSKFDPTLTKEADFNLNAKDKVKVQMMNQEGEYASADIPELDAQMISLRYKVNLTLLLSLKF